MSDYDQGWHDAIVSCAAIAGKEADLLIFTAHRLQSFSQANKLFFSEAELHDQAGTAIRVVEDKIKSLTRLPKQGTGCD